MESEAIETIYRENRQALYTLALSITRCESAAEDSIQQAFLAIQNVGSNPEGDSVAFVFRCVRNAAIDLHRKQARRNDVHACIFNGYVPPSQTEMDHVDSRTLTAERDKIIREAIQQLKDDARQIVLLKAFSDLTYKQISNVIGIPEKTAATTYRRALRSLSQKLKGQL